MFPISEVKDTNTLSPTCTRFRHMFNKLSVHAEGRVGIGFSATATLTSCSAGLIGCIFLSTRWEDALVPEQGVFVFGMFVFFFYSGISRGLEIFFSLTHPPTLYQSLFGMQNKFVPMANK